MKKKKYMKNSLKTRMTQIHCKFPAHTQTHTHLGVLLIDEKEEPTTKFEWDTHLNGGSRMRKILFLSLEKNKMLYTFGALLFSGTTNYERKGKI